MKRPFLNTIISWGQFNTISVGKDHNTTILGRGSTHLLKNTTQRFPKVTTISWRDILIFEEWMFILILLPWMKAIYDENKNDKRV
jgi:hypothetical protein